MKKMARSVKLTPNLDQNSTKILNLTVLQRIDSFIEEILMTAPHVTLYEFDIDNNQWSRKDVEGSLFVVKRNAQPRFQFIVMNRRNTDNLVENILGDFEFEVQVPYLLYRNAAQEVNGIWFYNSCECEELASLFNRILNAYTKVPSKPQISSSKREFEELEAVPTLAVIEGPLEPSSTSSTVTNAPEDSSFMNFFNMAMNVSSSNPSNGPNPVHTYHHTSPIPPISSQPPIITPSIPTTILPSNHHLTIPPPSINHYNTPDPTGNINNQIAANLLKPSSFFAPPSISSSSGLMVPQVSSYTPGAVIQPSQNLQRPPYAPLLQPFPPPTPPMSLTPSSAPPSAYGPAISRDNVRDALLMLAQDNQFIDMFYHALMKVQHL